MAARAGDTYHQRLQQYLVSRRPNSKGEWRLRCPLHDDSNPSANVNFEKGVFHCQVCGGCSLKELLRRMDGGGGDEVGEADYDPFESFNVTDLDSYRRRRNGEKDEPLSEAKVVGWHQALLDNQEVLERFLEARGLSLETVEKYKLGYERSSKRITIPVYDADNNLMNVRRYLMGADGGQKMWNASGHGSPARLYPVAMLEHDDILVVEGELDALIAIQYGFHAISGTGGAKKWEPAWTQKFKDKRVVLSYDNDDEGRRAAKSIARSLSRVAASVVVLGALTPENKSDITDFFVGGGTAEQLKELIADAEAELPDESTEAPQPVEVRVIGTMDSTTNRKPLVLSATVVGKKGPTYSVPAKAIVTCNMAAGPRCQSCTMLEADGEMEVTITRQDVEAIARLIDTPEERRADVLRRKVEAVKCMYFKVDEVLEQHTVEELIVMGSVDHASDEEADYTQRRVYNIGRWETPMNTTSRIEGTTWPNPKDSRNEFFAWDLQESVTSIDSFTMTPELMKKLKVFQPGKGQSPIDKCIDIALDLSDNVTGIYGRERLHVAMDLVWHSALSFNLHGRRMDKGWLEFIVVGDTRTGKSKIASELSKHYRLGHIIGCESATFAGLVGGVKQNNNSWMITWGEIPINDRRLVVLDEVSGLKQATISEMSDIRSRGIAQLTKVESAQVPARCRMVWISNPRKNSFVDEKRTDGIDILEDLIGNPEDIARFDFAMSVKQGDVPNEDINSYHRVTNEHVYTSELCHELVLWAWSRKPEHIVIGEDASKLIYDAAKWLGERYVGQPPLVQVQNAREKVARMAVALAMRTFSTVDGVHVVVRPEHVTGVTQFLHKLYSYDNFGYYRLSRRAIRNSQIARDSMKEVRGWLRERRRLVEFLLDRRGSSFRSQDLEEMAGMDRDDVEMVLDFLSERKMISKEKSQIVLEPELQEVLKGFDT